MAKRYSEKAAISTVPVDIKLPSFRPAEAAAFAKKRLAAEKALKSVPAPSDKKYSNWQRLGVPERFNRISIGGVAPKFKVTQSKPGYKIVAMPLKQAVKEWPKQAAPYLGEALPSNSHYFAALTGALYAEGAFVMVPKNTEADIEIDFPAIASKLNAYRTIIIVGENAKANITMVEKNIVSRAKTVVAHGVELYAEAGSRVSFYGLQQWPESVTHLAAYAAEVDRDAQLDWLIGSFGAGLSQVDVESGLAGEGATTNVRGVYYGSATQHIDQQLTADHIHGHTTSNTYARGIVADKAHAVYRGMIRINKGAHGSAADQNGHAMLLGNDARADAIPGLEIDADDVTAGHGATVGQIDDEQLFYLMARGLPEKKARQMIIDGFFEQLFSEIESKTVRKRFRSAVAAKRS